MSCKHLRPQQMCWATNFISSLVNFFWRNYEARDSEQSSIWMYSCSFSIHPVKYRTICGLSVVAERAARAYTSYRASSMLTHLFGDGFCDTFTAYSIWSSLLTTLITCPKWPMPRTSFSSKSLRNRFPNVSSVDMFISSEDPNPDEIFDVTFSVAGVSFTNLRLVVICHEGGECKFSWCLISSILDFLCFFLFCGVICMKGLFGHIWANTGGFLMFLWCLVFFALFLLRGVTPVLNFPWN